jgi:hypothetical protein
LIWDYDSKYRLNLGIIDISANLLNSQILKPAILLSALSEDERIKLQKKATCNHLLHLQLSVINNQPDFKYLDDNLMPIDKYLPYIVTALINLGIDQLETD